MVSSTTSFWLVNLLGSYYVSLFVASVSVNNVDTDWINSSWIRICIYGCKLWFMPSEFCWQKTIAVYTLLCDQWAASYNWSLPDMLLSGVFVGSKGVVMHPCWLSDHRYCECGMKKVCQKLFLSPRWLGIEPETHTHGLQSEPQKMAAPWRLLNGLYN